MLKIDNEGNISYNDVEFAQFFPGDVPMLWVTNQKEKVEGVNKLHAFMKGNGFHYNSFNDKVTVD